MGWCCLATIDIDRLESDSDTGVECSSDCTLYLSNAPGELLEKGLVDIVVFVVLDLLVFNHNLT